MLIHTEDIGLHLIFVFREKASEYKHIFKSLKPSSFAILSYPNETMKFYVLM